MFKGYDKRRSRERYVTLRAAEKRRRSVAESCTTDSIRLYLFKNKGMMFRTFFGL